MERHGVIPVQPRDLALMSEHVLAGSTGGSPPHAVARCTQLRLAAPAGVFPAGFAFIIPCTKLPGTVTWAAMCL